MAEVSPWFAQALQHLNRDGSAKVFCFETREEVIQFGTLFSVLAPSTIDSIPLKDILNGGLFKGLDREDALDIGTKYFDSKELEREESQSNESETEESESEDSKDGPKKKEVKEGGLNEREKEAEEGGLGQRKKGGGGGSPLLPPPFFLWPSGGGGGGKGKGGEGGGGAGGFGQRKKEGKTDPKNKIKKSDDGAEKEAMSSTPKKGIIWKAKNFFSGEWWNKRNPNIALTNDPLVLIGSYEIDHSISPTFINRDINQDPYLNMHRYKFALVFGNSTEFNSSGIWVVEDFYNDAEELEY